MPICHISRQNATLSEDNWSEVTTLDTSIGNWWLASRSPYDWQESRNVLEMDYMSSPLVQRQRMNMSGRTRPESMELSLNLVNSRSSETVNEIGTQSRNLPRPITSMTSHPTFMYDAMAVSNESLRIIWPLLRSSERCLYSGASLEQGSLEGPGQRPALTLTLKYQRPNSGTDTEDKNM